MAHRGTNQPLGLSSRLRLKGEIVEITQTLLEVLPLAYKGHRAGEEAENVAEQEERGRRKRLAILLAVERIDNLCL
ncbi:hypothetical protein D3C77_676560 [compost metagenome]